MKPYHHLTEVERSVLARMRQGPATLKAIATALGRAPSTLSRELKRNSPVEESGKNKAIDKDSLRLRYHAGHAHLQAVQRRRRASSRPRIRPEVWEQVHRLLVDVQAGPKQIAAVLPVSHESIYRWVYRSIAQGAACLAHCLRSARAARHRWRAQRQLQALRQRRPLAQRPVWVERRRQIGHFEADLVVSGSHQPSALLTLVERRTGAVLIRRVWRKDAKTVTRAIVAALRPLGAWVRSITTDNGSEFTLWRQLEQALQCKVYACQPRKPWQRAINEYTNGLLRQYFPKGSDAAGLSAAALKQAQYALNHRPRVRLKGMTPFDAFFKMTGVALQC